MYLIRRGWYFLTRNFPIQVGDRTIVYMQKIHSDDPDFKKIDIKYFADNYLVHEGYLPHGTENQYQEFNPAPKELPELPKIELPKEEVEPTIEKVVEKVVEEIVEPSKEPEIEAPKKGKKKKADDEAKS